MLDDVENIDLLSEHVARFIDDRAFGKACVATALQDVRAFSWSRIAALYYKEIYAPCLA
jgi:glycosyltransferase involved in cell wall biosynthesis